MEWNVATLLGLILSLLGIVASVVGVIRFLHAGNRPALTRSTLEAERESHYKLRSRPVAANTIGTATIGLVLGGVLTLGFGLGLLVSVGITRLAPSTRQGEQGDDSDRNDIARRKDNLKDGGVGIGIIPFGPQDDANRDIARLGIAKLEPAVSAHKLRHGEFPPNLQALTVPENGKDAYLDAKDLIDPWGKPYLYQPQLRNQVGKPRISTLTPRGEEISNQ